MQKTTNLISKLQQIINSDGKPDKLITKIKNTEEIRKIEKSEEKPKLNEF